MNKEKLTKMIMKLFSLKGKIGYTEIDIAAWIDVLHKFEESALSKAFNACLQKEGFFEIKHVLDELRPNNKDVAMTEWEKVLRVAKDGGQGYKELSEATKHTLSLVGGLQKLRLSESDFTLNQMKKTFIEAFDVNNKKIVYNPDTKTYNFFNELANKKQIGG
jgi:hypothetical protein